jgi:integrase
MRKLTLKITRRADGRVCKRIDGRLRIYPDEAAARKEIFGLIALREANPPAAVAATTASPPELAASVKRIFNEFLLDREARMNDGRLEKGTFLDYKDALDTFVAALESWDPQTPDSVSLLRREVPASALCPIHFRHIRAGQAKAGGSCMLERRVQGARTAFRWAWEIGRLIPQPPYCGDDYHKPTKANKRADKRKSVSKGGEPRFTVQEIRAVLKTDGLKPALRAMTWLALNSGMYSADCAALRWSDIKKEGRYTVIDSFREKAGVRQKLVLWPETVKALNAWKPLRPKPKGDTSPDLVFITVHGNPWTSENLTRDEDGLVKGGGETDSIKLLFNRLLVTLKIKRHGIGFGKFRHTHASAAGRHPDVNARRL